MLHHFLKFKLNFSDVEEQIIEAPSPLAIDSRWRLQRSLMVENQTVEPMDRALAALSREPEVFCCDNMNPLELLFFQLSLTLDQSL